MSIQQGEMAAGTYRTTEFEPSLQFTVGKGWRAMFPDDSDEVALEQGDDAIFLAMTRVSRVVDPSSFVGADVPDDLISWLAQHHALATSEPRSVEVAGISGMMVDACVISDREMFAYETGNMRVVSGDRVRYVVLPLDGPDLTIVIGTNSETGLDGALETVQPILDSLEIAN